MSGPQKSFEEGLKGVRSKKGGEPGEPTKKKPSCYIIIDGTFSYFGSNQIFHFVFFLDAL